MLWSVYYHVEGINVTSSFMNGWYDYQLLSSVIAGGKQVGLVLYSVYLKCVFKGNTMA